MLITLRSYRDKRYIYKYYMTSLWRALKGEGGEEKRERGFEKEGKLPPPFSPSIFCACHAGYK